MFDAVRRDALWYILLKIVINGKSLDVVMKMYKNIKSCIIVNGVKSEISASLAGVRQGENLSSLFFALLMT